jgi:hypothetical protein
VEDQGGLAGQARGTGLKSTGTDIAVESVEFANEGIAIEVS